MSERIDPPPLPDDVNEESRRRPDAAGGVPLPGGDRQVGGLPALPSGGPGRRPPGSGVPEARRPDEVKETGLAVTPSNLPVWSGSPVASDADKARWRQIFPGLRLPDDPEPTEIAAVQPIARPEGIAGMPITMIRKVHIPETASPRDPVDVDISGPLSAVHASGSRIVLGATGGEGHVNYFNAGNRIAGVTTPSGIVIPQLVPNAHGERVDGLEIREQLEALPFWQPVGVVQDSRSSAGLLQSVAQAAKSHVGRDFYEAWGSELPFGWVAGATPHHPTGAEIEAARRALKEARDTLQQYGDRNAANLPLHMHGKYANLPEQIVELERQYETIRTQELWKLNLLMGGQSPEEVRAMIQSFAAHTPMPPGYRLVPAGVPMRGYVDAGRPVDLPTSLVPTAALAAFKPPRREAKGISHSYEVTSSKDIEALPEGERTFSIGTDEDTGEEVKLAESDVANRMLVIGGPGKGKSGTLETASINMIREGIPTWLVDPEHQNLRTIIDRLPPELQPLVIRLGDASQPPIHLDLFEPVEGYPLETHMIELTDFLEANFHEAQMQSAVPGNIRDAVRLVYQRRGWDPDSGLPLDPNATERRYPDLDDLCTAIWEVAQGYYSTDPGARQYGKDLAAYLYDRFGGLKKGPAGRIFRGGHRASIQQLANMNLVVEGGAIPHDGDRQLALWALLNKKRQYRLVTMAARGDQAWEHHQLEGVTVIDEGSLVAGGRGQASAAMVRRVRLDRAIGEGYVFAAQDLSQLDPEIPPLASTWIVHATKPGAQRGAIGDSINATRAQIEGMPTQDKGVVLLSHARTREPKTVRITDPHSLPRQDTTSRPIAADIMTSANASCGPECQASCCTGKEIAQARIFADAPGPGQELTAWGELAVIGTLMGTEVGEPSKALRQSFQGMDPKTIECAIGRVVTAAIRDRDGIMDEGRISRMGLARLVAARMRARISGEPVSQDTDPALVLPQHRTSAEQPAPTRLSDLGKRSLLFGDVRLGDDPRTFAPARLETALDMRYSEGFLKRLYELISRQFGSNSDHLARVTAAYYNFAQENIPATSE